MSPTRPPSDQSDGSRARSRRALLASTGAAAASALAGCSVLRASPDVPAVHDGDWHSYGNGPSNANSVAGGLPEPDGREQLTPASWPYVPPVVHDGGAYFATGHRVVAIGVDGVERWSRRLDPEISGAVALDPGRDRLYVPTRSVSATDAPDPVPASVTTLSLPDGRVVDTTRVGDDRTYGVTVVDGDVYARSATACVRLSPDGTERWRRPLDPLVYEEYNLGDFTATQVAPAVAGDGVLVPDRDALVKLDPENGEVRWSVAVDTPYAAPVLDDGGVVQTGWRETVAVEPSGEVRWRRDLGSRAAAAAADGDLYVVPGDLHELDAATGETNWQAHVPSEGTAAPVVTGEAVLVATGDVRAFNRDTGGILGPDRERWAFSSVHAAAYCSPVVAAGRALVAGPAGLLALRPGENG